MAAAQRAEGQPLQVVFITTEVAPYSKVGGLADVLAALPPALAARGHRVMTVSPRYAPFEGALDTGVVAPVELPPACAALRRRPPSRFRKLASSRVDAGPRYVRYYLRREAGVDLVFVDSPLFEGQDPYGGGFSPYSGDGMPGSSDVRFSILCQAALAAPALLWSLAEDDHMEVRVIEDTEVSSVYAGSAVSSGTDAGGSNGRRYPVDGSDSPQTAELPADKLDVALAAFRATAAKGRQDSSSSTDNCACGHSDTEQQHTSPGVASASIVSASSSGHHLLDDLDGVVVQPQQLAQLELALTGGGGFGGCALVAAADATGVLLPDTAAGSGPGCGNIAVARGGSATTSGEVEDRSSSGGTAGPGPSSTAAAAAPAPAASPQASPRGQRHAQQPRAPLLFVANDWPTVPAILRLRYCHQRGSSTPGRDAAWERRLANWQAWRMDKGGDDPFQVAAEATAAALAAAEAAQAAAEAACQVGQGPAGAGGAGRPPGAPLFAGAARIQAALARAAMEAYTKGDTGEDTGDVVIADAAGEGASSSGDEAKEKERQIKKQCSSLQTDQQQEGGIAREDAQMGPGAVGDAAGVAVQPGRRGQQVRDDMQDRRGRTATRSRRRSSRGRAGSLSGSAHSRRHSSTSAGTRSSSGSSRRECKMRKEREVLPLTAAAGECLGTGSSSTRYRASSGDERSDGSDIAAVAAAKQAPAIMTSSSKLNIREPLTSRSPSPIPAIVSTSQPGQARVSSNAASWQFAERPETRLRVGEYYADMLLLRRLLRDALQGAKGALCIHNMAFQGRFPRSSFERLCLPERALQSLQCTCGGLAARQKRILAGEECRCGGELNWLKAAIRECDLLLTVSPNYAHEVTDDPGMGHGLTEHVAEKGIIGIMNGIDTVAWDPEADALLPSSVRYGPHCAVEGKALAKTLLQLSLGMDPDLGAPLFAFIGRLTEQKGVDLLLAAAPGLLREARKSSANSSQLVILGTGGAWEEMAARELANAFPSQAAAILRFDERLARLLYAAADFVVVPSRFEPCGLVAQCAARYGALPVVAPTGGLRDLMAMGRAAGGSLPGYTVQPAGPAHDPGATREAAQELQKVLCQAASEYGTPKYIEKQQACLALDLSWDEPAAQWEQALRSMLD